MIRKIIKKVKCNHCLLENIKTEANECKKGIAIVGLMGLGIYVFLTPLGKTKLATHCAVPSAENDFKGDDFYREHFVMWMAEVPKKCTCEAQ